MPSLYQNITAGTAARMAAGDPSAKPNTFIRDTGIPGFAILIGKTKSSFVVESRAGRRGRNIRVTLGTVSKLPLEDARRRAKETIARLANGVDVVADARAEAVRGITLEAALKSLLAARDLKPGTRDDYIRSVETIAEWKTRPLADITADMVLTKWTRLPGKTSAARVFRVLRTIWNFARQSGAELGESPTKALRNVRRGWAQPPRRRRLIPDGIMPAWRKAVDGIGSEGMRDLVLFVLYTGCRIGEARALAAVDVSLLGSTFRIAAPKNNRAIELPIVTQLIPVLDRRLAAAPRGPIFPQDQSRYWLKPTLTACPWSWHDLRRGYVTAAHRAGTDPEVARALVNHAAPGGDAHAGYVVLSADGMRRDAQRVADFLDQLGNREP